MYKIALIALFTVSNITADAPDYFMSVFKGFSKKKITYITMDNGDKFEVNLMKFKFSKGQSGEIKN